MNCGVSVAFSLGFYPICLITFPDHNNQHHKCESDYHFLSQVLQIFPSPIVIKKKDVDSLWSFLQRFETYYKLVKAADPTPHTFIELSSHLKKMKSTSSFGSVIHALATVQRNAPCFFLGLKYLSVTKKKWFDSVWFCEINKFVDLTLIIG